MANIHKDEVFNLFKNNGFSVKLFYKPTMRKNDMFYHIILDSVLDIQLRLFNDNFIVINGVLPLSSEYMETKYEHLIKTFINQDTFSIAIERLGNTQCLNNTCIKLGLPCVVDDRFITIPKKLYNMYKRYYKDDETKCGLYIAAVVGDLESMEVQEDVEREPEPEVIVKEVEVPVEVIKEVPVEVVKEVIKEVEKPKVKIEELPFENQICELIGDGCELIKYEEGTLIVRYMGLIEIEFGITNIGLDIIRVSPVNNVTPPSNVYYMQTFERLERIVDYYDIVVRNIRNETIYKICQIREYEKVIDVRGSRRSFGSYKMKKYN